MADPSVIVQIVLAKYDLSLPLHRQERASSRQGFYLPRSTQCGWLGEAYDYVYRIVDAMMLDARVTAHCIATDATGAPVRQHGKCAGWHVFVFIADLTAAEREIIRRPWERAATAPSPRATSTAPSSDARSAVA